MKRKETKEKNQRQSPEPKVEQGTLETQERILGSRMRGLEKGAM
jgi:hypothetical protein